MDSEAPVCDVQRHVEAEPDFEVPPGGLGGRVVVDEHADGAQERSGEEDLPQALVLSRAEPPIRHRAGA